MTLYVERLYGSQGTVKIDYRTVSSSAMGNDDFLQIENGAIQLGPEETQESIRVTVSFISTILCAPSYAGRLCRATRFSTKMWR